MYKKIVVLVMLTMSSINAKATFGSYGVSCANEDSSFKIEVLRTYFLTDLSGALPFEEGRLSMIEIKDGYMSTTTKYKTMDGGVLTISEETLMGRGGCGRGSCENQPKIISAQFVNMNGDEFYYGCSKISL